ncbi:hypothetical protein K4K94_08015 [Phaeobacter inhibens]|uniref:hypothetical protein n=1 Tax=Phaeobacter inhibens TaxID=221822 RepID=UPI0021A91D14|nr:hypothetical protein [Phaeobacter inhibens]UWS05654.1 hypothetical protein K4K94_08015 [Phaeobacter inhibens]
MRHITLHCTSCDQRMPYFSEPDKEPIPIPETVETITMPGCSLCDDGGSFITETWLDADGQEVEQPIH